MATVWTPTPGSTTQYVAPSSSSTEDCEDEQQVISVNVPPSIVLTNQTNAIPPIAYHFTQSVPASVWTIEHNLNFYPNVTVVDSAGTNVEGELHYIDSNNLTVTFTSAFSGSAYLS